MEINTDIMNRVETDSKLIDDVVLKVMDIYTEIGRASCRERV